MVNSNSVDDDETNDDSSDDPNGGQDSELVESDTLDFVGIYELFIIMSLALFIVGKNNVRK